MEIDQIKKFQKTNRRKHPLLDWFKFIAGILTVGLIAFKLAFANWTIDFSKFDFNALLALLLSIFAISLSVAFYFKATDTSNLFYDNTYKFTKEISEILGRIEAGFGERLRHLDEGYSGLVNKFDNGFTDQNIKETKEEIEKEKLKLKQEIQERNEILNSLLENAQLEQHEKEQIRKQLKEKEIEITRQNREINFLRNRLHNDNDVEDILHLDLPDSVMKLLLDFVRKSNIHPETFLKYPSSIISRKYRLPLNELTRQELSILMNMKIINEEGEWTIHGIKLIRNLVKKYM